MKSKQFLTVILSCIGTLISLTAVADRYVVIKFELPQSQKYMTYLFDSQGNRCWQVLDHLYERYLKNCKGCQTIQNACVDVLPANYSGVFKKAPVTNPYMLLEGPLTQAVVYEGFGENTFNSMCRVQQKNSTSTSCVTPAKTIVGSAN